MWKDEVKVSHDSGEPKMNKKTKNLKELAVK